MQKAAQNSEPPKNKSKAKKRRCDLSQHNSDNLHNLNDKKARHSPKTEDLAKKRIQEWVDYYAKTKLGIWIECTECKKWRKVYEYNEGHEVPEDWHCSMSLSENGIKKSCDDLEIREENDFPEQDYSPGSVVWAKLDGFPWWPGMVEDDPVTEGYYYKDGKSKYYNVTFLDDAVTHAWIPASRITSFPNPAKGSRSILGNYNSRYFYLIQKAKENAKLAIAMPIQERLKKFSFAFLYKGKWPAAKMLNKKTTQKVKVRSVDSKRKNIKFKEESRFENLSTEDSDLDPDYKPSKDYPIKHEKEKSQKEDANIDKEDMRLKNNKSINECEEKSDTNKENKHSQYSTTKTSVKTSFEQTSNKVKRARKGLDELGYKKQTQLRVSTTHEESNEKKLNSYGEIEIISKYNQNLKPEKLCKIKKCKKKEVQPATNSKLIYKKENCKKISKYQTKQILDNQQELEIIHCSVLNNIKCKRTGKTKIRSKNKNYDKTIQQNMETTEIVIDDDEQDFEIGNYAPESHDSDFSEI